MSTKPSKFPLSMEVDNWGTFSGDAGDDVSRFLFQFTEVTAQWCLSAQDRAAHLWDHCLQGEARRWAHQELPASCRLDWDALTEWLRQRFRLPYHQQSGESVTVFEARTRASLEWEESPVRTPTEQLMWFWLGLRPAVQGGRRPSDFQDVAELIHFARWQEVGEEKGESKERTENSTGSAMHQVTGDEETPVIDYPALEPTPPPVDLIPDWPATPDVLVRIHSTWRSFWSSAAYPFIPGGPHDAVHRIVYSRWQCQVQYRPTTTIDETYSRYRGQLDHLNKSHFERFRLPDSFVINGHLPVAGAPALLCVEIAHIFTAEERVHSTPWKLRPLGGCDEDFFEPNPSQAVHLPQDTAITRHADWSKRAGYLAKNVHQHLNPLYFQEVVPKGSRGYLRTERFPRGCQNALGLDGCACPVAVRCRTLPQDVEWLKTHGEDYLFCIIEPLYTPSILHRDEETNPSTRRYIWLQPRMDYRVTLYGAGAEDWEITQVNIVWSEAGNDSEVNHKRLKKLILTAQLECAPMRDSRDEEKSSGGEEAKTQPERTLEAAAQQEADLNERVRSTEAALAAAMGLSLDDLDGDWEDDEEEEEDEDEDDEDTMEDEEDEEGEDGPAESATPFEAPEKHESSAGDSHVGGGRLSEASGLPHKTKMEGQVKLAGERTAAEEGLPSIPPPPIAPSSSLTPITPHPALPTTSSRSPFDVGVVVLGTAAFDAEFQDVDEGLDGVEREAAPFDAATAPVEGGIEPVIQRLAGTTVRDVSTTSEEPNTTSPQIKREGGGQ